MRWVSACALAVPLLACRGNPAPIDWGKAEAEGRVVDRRAGRSGSRAVSWGDGVVDLTYVEKPVLWLRQPELNTTLTGAGGNATVFKVDTAGGATEISAAAPLAREAIFWRDETIERVGRVRENAFCGRVPVARWGPLECRDLPVTVTERTTSYLRSRNLLGGVALWSTQIEHLGGRWAVRSGTSRLAASEPGWQVVSFVPCRYYPVVRLFDGQGRELLALVDTGAYASIALAGFAEGTYSLRDSAGRSVAQVPITRSGKLKTRIFLREDRARWDAPREGVPAREVGLLVGMDFLAAHEWRMTFDQGQWAFPPKR